MECTEFENGWEGNLINIEPHSGYWINIHSSIDWDIYFEFGKIEAPNHCGFATILYSVPLRLVT